MSVSNGQKADDSTFNAAFVSRTVDDNKAGKLTLDNADTAISGNSVTNVQREHNSIASFVGKTINTAKDVLPTWASNLIGTVTDNLFNRIEAVQVTVESNQSDIADVRTTTGTIDGDTDMGAYTAGNNGFAVTDNTDQASLNQELVNGIDARQLLSEKAQVNGYASLDGTGKIPISQMPTNAMTFEGNWNATTNSPTLVDGTGTQGQFYNVSVAGTQNLGSGSLVFNAGDSIIYDGSVWVKLDNVDEVTLNNSVIVTNKTMNAANNTFSNFSHGSEVDNPSSGVHGVTGSIVGTSDVQVITAKDIDGGLASNSNRLTAPKNTTSALATLTNKEGTIAYDTTKAKPVYNDGASWLDMGSGGSGQGGINYIQNSDFESDVTTGIINDGSGNAVSSAETINPLRGTQSLNMQFKSTALGGEYIQHGMDDVDNQDLGKRVFVKFDYATDTNYVSNDVKVILRNLDSGVDVTVSDDNDGLIQATGGVTSRRKFVGVAEIDSVDNTYAPRFVINSVPVTTSNIIVDNISVGPDVPVPGSIIEDWQVASNPDALWNGTINNGTIKVTHRRVGDSMEIEYNVRFGSTTSFPSSILLTIPDSKIIDTNKSAEGAGANQIYGSAWAFDSGTAFYTGQVAYASTTTLSIYSNNNGGSWNASNPFAWSVANNDNFAARAVVPISNWTSGALLSTTETLFSADKALYTGNPLNSIITNGTPTTMRYPTKQIDKFGSYDTSTGIYTIIKTGVYDISAATNLTGSFGSHGDMLLEIKINGILFLGRETTNSSTSGSIMGVDINAKNIPLNKGDQVRIDLTPFSWSSVSFIINSSRHWFSISESSDFSTFSIHGQNEQISALSSVFNMSTSGSTNWAQMVGNSVDLTPGLYLLHGSVNQTWGAVAPTGLTRVVAVWASVNGNNTNTKPSALSQIVSNPITDALDLNLSSGNINTFRSPVETVRVLVTQTTTVYLVPRADFTTANNGTLQTSIYAERLA